MAHQNNYSANSIVEKLTEHFHSTRGSIGDFFKRILPAGTPPIVVPIVGAVGVIGIGAVIVYLTSGKKNQDRIYIKIEPITDLQKQTVEISPDHARVSALVGNKELIERLHDDAKTLYESFRRGAKLSITGECLGYRTPSTTNGRKLTGPYVWITYNDVLRRSEYLARGFVEKGLKPGQDTMVGVFAQNRPEWIITEQACYFYSMVIVPLYDTLGPEACTYIINQAEIRLVVVDRSKKAAELLEKHDQCPCLRVIVLLEPAESDLSTLAHRLRVEIVQFSHLEKVGSAAIKRTPKAKPPTPDDLATISYTSGTTGPPKGVMLTHGNVIADCTGLSMIKYVSIDSSDTLLSFLPLAHMFERVVEAMVFSVGGRIGYYGGDIKNLTDDIKELRPTVFAVVPRVLNRIYDKVMQEAHKSRLKKYLIEKATRSKVGYLNQSIVRNDTIWDKIVFKRVREGMGGRIRLMITGSAPLSSEILTFIRAAMGCIVLEGYGQTECVAACTVGLEGDHIPGHVGPPIPCCQIKLVDVPEMNYFARENKGEVCIKGHNVFKGYFKDPEKTAETLDTDGWLHTGDIGLWTENGTLKLIDRKKHIFKLAQGEYIAPEKIENVLLRSKYVGQIFVHGESLKSCLVAIVCPDADVLVPYATKELNLKGDLAELCRNDKVKQLILEDIKSEGQKGGLQSFEQIKDIFLFPEPFTVENGFLTPTMKTKRSAVKDYFKQQIDLMYLKLW